MKMKDSKIMIISILLLLLFSTSQIARSFIDDQSSTSFNDANTVSRVVILSLDAFRYDFLEKADLPAFEWLIENGIKADYCVPSNPSLTAVNHVTLITGDHAGTHGILGNTFYDWTDNKSYSLFAEASDPYRDTNTGLHLLQSKPSVIHAEENELETAVFGWPYLDEETYFDGQKPTYVFDYDYLGQNNIRTNNGILGKVLEVIKAHPEVALYYAWLPAVDSTTHFGGPDSPNLDIHLASLNNTINSFLTNLELEDLLKDTVVILTSDHGMAYVDDDDYFLEDKPFYLNAVTQTGLDPYIAVDAAMSYLYFFDETNTTKVEEFADYLRGEDGIQAIYVNEQNALLNLDNDVRGVNISVWLEPGRSRNFGGSYQGMHGYLNNNTDMHGIFIAAGPGIKQDTTITEVNTIDVAPTALSLLGIEAGFTSDGAELSSIFGTRTSEFSYPVEVTETHLSFVSFLLILFIVPIIKKTKRRRKK